MKTKITLLLSILIVGSGFFLTTKYYSFLFAKIVHGEIIAIDRVTHPSAIFNAGSQIPASQVFSFAIAIKDKTGEIITASTEDRQWAVAQTGQCVEAKFFPYPPWQMDKGGTFFGARLVRLYECGSRASE